MTLRRALLGLAADVLGRFARGAQQPRRLLAERVEQLLLVERRGARSCSSSSSSVSTSSLLALARRGQLFGDPLQEARAPRFGVAAERRPERAVRDVFGQTAAACC